MKNKKKADWLDWLLRIAIVLGIIGTFYFSYSPAKNYVTAKQEEAKIEEVSKKVVENTNDYPDVKEIKKSTNEDVVGWIRVPGTNIDEPILQTTDNDYYLNHSLTKEELDVGSIFLDAKANSNYDNNFNFVFGHNTYIDNKFTQLILTDKFETFVITENNVKRPVSQLSGGELSAAAIALRLAIALFLNNGQQHLLILDEVLTAMSSDRSQLILETITSLTNAQIILIAHNDGINSFADKVVHL